MSHSLNSSQRLFLLIAVAGIALLSTDSSNAALIFDSYNAASQWPATAPVRTMDFTPTTTGRGVRSDRIHAQSFQVASTIDVDKILIGYQWAGNVNFPYSVRLVEVNDVFANAYIPGTQVAAPIAIPGNVNEPNPDAINNPSRSYALQLHWDPSSSGGLQLTLSPRTGNQGYALEMVGSGQGAGTSPIAMIHSTTSTYASGRSYEMQGAVALATPGANTDFEIAITAVPEPSAFVLALCATLACGWGLHRQGKVGLPR